VNCVKDPEGDPQRKTQQRKKHLPTKLYATAKDYARHKWIDARIVLSFSNIHSVARLAAAARRGLKVAIVRSRVRLWAKR